VRATQRWSVHLAQIPQKDERAAFLTEAAAVKAALYQNKTLDTMKQQSSSTSVTKGDKDGEYVVTLNVTMATPTLKPGEVEHTSTSSDPAQETKTQIAKDDKAPKDLPELNLSIFGKDAAASMHAGDKDDSNSVATAKAQLEEQKKAIDAERETIASWREYQVAKELIDTDPSDKNLLDTRDNLKAAFDKEGAAHKKADKDFKVDSKTYIKLEQDMLVQDLKKAEYDYKVAKNDTDKATARKNAVHAAWLIMEKQADLLIGVEQEKGVFEARLNIEHALHDLDVALGQETTEARTTYIQALVTFLTDPSAKDAVKTLNAAKKAYENPKKAETVTPDKGSATKPGEKKQGSETTPASTTPQGGKKAKQGTENPGTATSGSTTAGQGQSGKEAPSDPKAPKQK